MLFGEFSPRIELNSPHLIIGSSGYLVGLAGFIGITITAAAFSRAIMRFSGIASFFVSIILASFSMLLTKLILVAFGIRFPISTAAKETTNEFLYWGTVLVFLVVNAEKIVHKLADWDANPDRSESAKANDRATAMLLVAPIGLVLWVAAVRQGLVIFVTG